MKSIGKLGDKTRFKTSNDRSIVDQLETTKMKNLPFLLFVSSCMYSQIKGIVLDESNKPIPYVNIWVENENIGTTSEENGSFSIHVEDQNKVFFSALVLKPKKVKFSEAVVLKEKLFSWMR
jgi:hypothetical protein